VGTLVRTYKTPSGTPIFQGDTTNVALPYAFPELADGTMRAVWNDLYNYGIVSVTPNLLGAGISPIGSEALVGQLSEFGKLLVDFIGSPS
jgi:hypothetical protein